jgi:uridine kinase
MRATRCIEPEGVIVVDGLYSLYWAEIRELLHTKIFVDADHDVCLARRVERDVRDRGRTEASVREQYGRTVRPMYDRYVRPTREFADLVLRGEAPPDLNVAAILTHLRRVWSGTGRLR